LPIFIMQQDDLPFHYIDIGKPVLVPSKYESNKRTSRDCLNLLEKKKETCICKS